MELILDALLAWLDVNTKYSTGDVPKPELVELSPAEMTREMYSDAMQLIPSDGVDERIFGLYSAEIEPSGRIYVVDARYMTDAGKFDDPHDNPIWREIVLHELVHHLQWQSGAVQTWECRNFGELEAYMIGGRYLRQLRVRDPMANRRFEARIRARC